MADIKGKIFSVEPREKSGSVASNRFDFQKNWAICKILELHQEPDDYLLTLEYHDDIIVFDSSTEPNKISFYQVKTNATKNWTIQSLVSRKKGKEGLLNSHLGKLFDHLKNFGGSVKSLNFVTNAKIKGVLADKSKCEDVKEFKCGDLDKTDLDKILNQLKEEHSLNDLLNFEDMTFFKLGELSVDHHTEITKTKLLEFIEANFPDIKYQISPLYRAIFDEIKKKSNFELNVKEFDELKKFKSISRDGFESYIQTVQSASSMKDVASAIENRLNSEGVDFRFVKTFKLKAAQYEINKMKYNDRTLNVLVNMIKKLIKCKSSEIGSRLYDNMQMIFREVDLNSLPTHNMDEDYVKAIILFELYG